MNTLTTSYVWKRLLRQIDRFRDSVFSTFKHIEEKEFTMNRVIFSRYLDVIIISNQPGINENLMLQPRFGHTCLVESWGRVFRDNWAQRKDRVWCMMLQVQKVYERWKNLLMFPSFLGVYLKSDYMHWCNVVFHVRFSTPRSGDCLLCFNDRPGRGWRCFSTQKQMNMFQVAAGDVQGRKVSEENDWMILGNDDVLLRFFFVSWIGLLLWF